jgi:hypothetical protein
MSLPERKEYLCLKGTNNMARGNAPGVSQETDRALKGRNRLH